MNSYIRSLKKGILRGYILYVLNNLPNAPKGLCGIEILEKIKQDLEMKLGSGTLYPILHEMESRGVISGKWDVSDGIRKKYYRITENGRVLLTKFCKQLKHTVMPLLQMEAPIPAHPASSVE
ncbi:MAG: PadR family transcriptional regulator [Candidatus Heimdallarchaeota archaeon]